MFNIILMGLVIGALSLIGALSIEFTKLIRKKDNGKLSLATELFLYTGFMSSIFIISACIIEILPI